MPGGVEHRRKPRWFWGNWLWLLQQWPCTFILQLSLRLYQDYHTGFSYLSPEGPWWEEWSASLPPITSTPQQILFPAGCSTIGPNGATILPQQPCKCSPSAGYLQCLWLLLSKTPMPQMGSSDRASVASQGLFTMAVLQTWTLPVLNWTAPTSPIALPIRYSFQIFLPLMTLFRQTPVCQCLS